MDVLFNKEWWQILLIIITTVSSLSFLLFMIVRLNGNIKVGKFSFGGEKQKIIPAKHQDYLEFCILFKDLNQQIRTKIRQYCVENGMEHLEGEDWENYKHDRMEQLGRLSFQYMTENYGEKTVTIEELMTYRINERDELLTNILKNSTHKMFESLRELSTDVKLIIAKRNIDMLAHVETTVKGFYPGMNIVTAVELVYDSGKRLVEIENIKNRDLVKKQMSKVDDMLVQAYAELTIRYLSILSKKLQNEKI